ncbi:MAG: alanine--tRNA ligase [Candidatus Eisenbacteria bacterium]|uniref:Alanine--tRNA ligase n=1 Tax=Eiseniibacteriota bacterium TaxID=2212470 RepID=A0A948W5J3_UNCEI|nr:alanine--tRNA ligase [Candidatus Eisenbacteria bacterium]MBU1950650.1 alanine--tRNA ligase [Candidatus Eisenbacteria bacterium]MBU2689651.1 alanine--tRNA ligase [Candidatus Eisenbacteria bacterium]
MTAADIRRIFLEFYKERDHRFCKSAPLLPQGDPTLLFTSAGMVPFKSMWVTANPEYRRAVSVQKCLRATDLEDVGRTPRHCTFFEMLGHFSFGDYFKREAISWNWELFRNVYGIPEERMRVSVFNDDDEAFAIWRDEIGLPEDWIFRLGEEHNFWGPAGDTGPCGPSSEVYYDLGPSFECSNPNCGPGCDCDRWVEIGNFVFPQFDKQPDGSLAPLLNRGIDTGIGLERVVMVLQGQQTIFATDLFQPVIRRLEEFVQKPYAGHASSMNIVADHVRALTFAFAEGIMPSNEGRGYVLRRILRRAALQGHLMGLREPFLHRLAETVTEVMSPAYPELVEALPRVSMALKGEEERFTETLEAGLNRFERLAQTVRDSESKRLAGKDAFLLYDTYGFPLDLVREMAAEQGLEVDEEGFTRQMERQKEKSRSASTFQKSDGESLEWTEYSKGESSRFVGNESLEIETRVRRIAPVPDKPGEYWVVLEETPFYPESGGQVGDIGILFNDGLESEVLETQKRSGEILHRVKLSRGGWNDKPVRASVSASNRISTARNHTATHLLHAALREVLGTHVTQAGSLVSPARLRFDFTHYGPVEPEPLAAVEQWINDRILQAIPVNIHWSDYDAAIEAGVMALFGEKYEDRVRRVEIGEASRELCGGTHVRNTAEIGQCILLEEGTISAGIRRIEAVTGEQAFLVRREMQETMRHLRRSLQVPQNEIAPKVDQLFAEIAKLRKDVRNALEQRPSSNLEDLIKNAESIGGRKFVVGQTEAASVDLLRKQGDHIVKALGSGAGLLVARVGDKMPLLAFVTQDLVSEIDLRADELIRTAAAVSGGRGGGKPRMALGGVGDPEKLEETLETARNWLREKLRV